MKNPISQGKPVIRCNVTPSTGTSTIYPSLESICNTVCDHTLPGYTLYILKYKVFAALDVNSAAVKPHAATYRTSCSVVIALTLCLLSLKTSRKHGFLVVLHDMMAKYPGVFTTGVFLLNLRHLFKNSSAFLAVSQRTWPAVLWNPPSSFAPFRTALTPFPRAKYTRAAHQFSSCTNTF